MKDNILIEIKDNNYEIDNSKYCIFIIKHFDNISIELSLEDLIQTLLCKYSPKNNKVTSINLNFEEDLIEIKTENKKEIDIEFKMIEDETLIELLCVITDHWKHPLTKEQLHSFFYSDILKHFTRLTKDYLW